MRLLDLAGLALALRFILVHALPGQMPVSLSLTRTACNRPTLTVTRNLLGKFIVRHVLGRVFAAMIVGSRPIADLSTA
jgi:hypothetical protein